MPSNDVLEILAHPPFRVVSVEENFLFVERGPSTEASTTELRSIASRASGLSSTTSILLLAALEEPPNRAPLTSHYRLAALVDLGVEDLLVQNLASIRAIGIPRQLTLHFGKWTGSPGKDARVDFIADEVVEAKFRVLHERLESLLRPWTALFSVAATPRAGSTPSASLPARAKQTIELRERLLRDVKMVDAKQWAAWRGLESSLNPSAALGKHKQAGRVFAVQHGQRDLYPEFQFARDAKPLPGMADVLSKVPEDARGWPLLSWFEAENRLLDGKKPMDLLVSAPDQVAGAAARFYSTDE